MSKTSRQLLKQIVTATLNYEEIAPHIEEAAQYLAATEAASKRAAVERFGKKAGQTWLDLNT